MATDPIISEINAVTYQVIYPQSVEDLLFLNAPFLAYMRGMKNFRPWDGGTYDQNAFLYRALIGGAYRPGKNFNLTKRQTTSVTLFDPRLYYTSVVEYKEDLQIFNTGKSAVFRLIDLDMQNAIQTLSAIVAVDLAQNGTLSTRAGWNVVGWTEAMNDGLVPSWDGNVYTSYGTSPRNGAVGTKLNGNVFWLGNPDGSAAPLSYSQFVQMFLTASRGFGLGGGSTQPPNLIVMNKALLGAILQRLQVQQRFDQKQDPYWGAETFRFMGSSIIADEYFPSLAYGQNDPDLGNWLTGTATYTAPSSPQNGFQNITSGVTSLTVGEVICMFNMNKWIFKLSSDPEFAFGWSGFVPEGYSTRLAGQVKAALALECLAPYNGAQGYGLLSN